MTETPDIEAVRCRFCGCDDERACVDEATGAACFWAAPGVCSSCARALTGTGLLIWLVSYAREFIADEREGDEFNGELAPGPVGDRIALAETLLERAERYIAERFHRFGR